MAVNYNLVIEQGARFYRLIYWLDEDGNGVDLSSYTAKMQGRQTKSASGTLFEWTSAAGDITLGSDGSIVIDVDDSDTATLDFDYGLYDLVLTDGSSNVTRLLEGVVSLSRRVTQ